MSLDKNNIILDNVDSLEYNTECLISGKPIDQDMINNKNVIKLKCGHSFLYDYFLKSLKVINKHRDGYNRCPYCFTSVGRVPLVISKTKLCQIARRIEKRDLKMRLSQHKDKSK